LLKILSLLLSLFIVLPLSGGETEKKPPKDTRALEKSLLFPGWGQLQEKKIVKGLLFMAGELIAITGAVIANSSGNRNYNRYKSSKTLEDAVFYRQETERYDKRRNLFIAAGIGIWIINMVDIYLYKKKDRRKGIRLSLKGMVSNEISLDIGYYF